ncbi:hypothetical protein SKAU_G00223180 [Synaphobranchus kaupii]|uniref:Uncharacterized protein n=1 Tax=Synaphobranchus kaupii TaxID=118154 RepID=A0A9Q1IW27_SYNKA|nr:hypothetical protein SKAU_G00223180 [Synaphobranchus kaupii]
MRYETTRHTLHIRSTPQWGFRSPEEAPLMGWSRSARSSGMSPDATRGCGGGAGGAAGKGEGPASHTTVSSGLPKDLSKEPEAAQNMPPPHVVW